MRDKSFNHKNNNNILKLRKVDGIKFRAMWSSKILYALLILVGLSVTAASIFSVIREGRLLNYIKLFRLAIVFVPMLFLCFINKKFLGIIVAVVDEKGIYTKDKIILWNQVKEIKYHVPIIPEKGSLELYEYFCSLTVYTNNNAYEILHAPRCMIKYIKEYVPNVKVIRDSEFIFEILMIFVMISIGSIIFGFHSKL